MKCYAVYGSDVELLGDELDELVGHVTGSPQREEILGVEAFARVTNGRVTYVPRRGRVGGGCFSERQVHL